MAIEMNAEPTIICPKCWAEIITKQWAKREEQINRVMQSTVGMYGDLQGIAGKSLQEIEGLEIKALEAPVAEGAGCV